MTVWQQKVVVFERGGRVNYLPKVLELVCQQKLSIIYRDAKTSSIADQTWLLYKSDSLVSSEQSNVVEWFLL